jgi:hypothetical protein
MNGDPVEPTGSVGCCLAAIFTFTTFTRAFGSASITLTTHNGSPVVRSTAWASWADARDCSKSLSGSNAEVAYAPQGTREHALRESDPSAFGISLLRGSRLLLRRTHRRAGLLGRSSRSSIRRMSMSNMSIQTWSRTITPGFASIVASARAAT